MTRTRVCANRANQDPTIATCQVDLGPGLRTGCKCRVLLQAELQAVTPSNDDTPIGQPRTPDSARPTELGEDVA